MEDLVSIITPMYNSEKYISEMIESVINQSYSNWELIIVDDSSIDTSCSIVENYILKNNKIKLIKQKTNNGPAEARNIGIRNSKGKYIAFLDSDDLWHKEKLKIQIKFMTENNIALTCTSYEIVSYNLKSSYGKFIVPSKITYKDMLKKNYFSCDTVVINKDYMKNINMESFEKHEDYITWLKYLKEVNLAYGISDVLAYYRISDNTRSSSKKNNIIPLYKVYYKFEKLGILKSGFYLLNYIIISIFKYRKKIINKSICR